MAIAVARFRELSRQFYHSPGRRVLPEYRRLYHIAQQELWNLAQTICGQVHPCVQRELDDVRRTLVGQLEAKYPNGQVTGASMVSTKARRPFSWQEVQLTPEMTLDQSLSGYAVVYGDVTRLKAAMRAQAAALRRLTG